jgi:hypothetical protein
MSPDHQTLLNRSARRRRAERLAGWRFHPADDWLLATPFDPGCHVVHYQTLPREVLERLRSIEHVIDPATGRQGRRPMTLWLGGTGRYAVPAGLAPLVAQAVARQGGRPGEPVRPDVTQLVAVADPLVPAALAAHGRAVVRLRAGVSTACIISGLVAAFPQRRVAVLVPCRRSGGHLAKLLRDQRVDAKAYYEYAITVGRPPRVIVGTSAGLTSPAAWHTGCSVVVATDAVNFCTTAETALRCETAWRNAKWLGLVPPDRQLAPIERDLLTAFFGPHWLELPAHGRVRRRVVFAAQQITLPADAAYDRLVLRLAGELSSGCPITHLSNFGVVHQAADLAKSPVVLLTYDGHHRRRLLRAQRPADRGRVAVVTPNELGDVRELGVLVRADWRVGRPPLSDHVLIEAQIDRRPLLVIDTLGPDAADLGCRRATAYLAAGWVPLEAEVGGYAEWDAWLSRRFPGGRRGDRSRLAWSHQDRQ